MRTFNINTFAGVAEFVVALATGALDDFILIAGNFRHHCTVTKRRGLYNG